MKTETIIHNQRPVEIPEGDDLQVWCHLAPFGEFKRITDNREVVQRCDQQAFEQLIANFAPEVLVDFEHNSELGGDTVASGWAQQLRLAEDGLEVLIRYTDIGAEAIRNRRLRFLSPIWRLDPQGRPVGLGSIGLTNKPYFDLRPVLNKDRNNHSPATVAGQKTTTHQKGVHHMDTKQIALALGLAEDASAEDILAAIKAVQDNALTLESRLAELENKALEDEAEKVANANATKIANKDDFKKLYVANKEIALKLLATIKAAPAAASITNKAAAKPPAAFTGDAVSNKLDVYEAMPHGPEKRQYLRANAAEINSLRNKRDGE